jgi:hypothetical protein
MANSLNLTEAELKDYILRMADQSRYGILNGRKLYQIFTEASAKDISTAVRELEQEDKLSIKGIPHGFQVFQCVFVRKNTP